MTPFTDFGFCPFDPDTLEKVAVDESTVLGEIGHGSRIAMGTIDMTRTRIGVIGTRIATAAFEEAVDYTGVCDQSGQPVDEYQAVQVLVADMDARLEGAPHLNKKDNNK